MKQLNIKNSIDSAVSQFFTSVPVNPAEEKTDAMPNLIVPNLAPIQNRAKNGKEKKTKRFNLLFVPSLFDCLEKIAYVQNISINEAVNKAIEFYCNANKVLIEQYTQIEKLKTSHETEQ